MRFATFNISSGRSPVDGRIEEARFAAAIAALDADVLAMQEVDRGQPRSGELNLTEIAASAMGAPYRLFAPALYGTPGTRWTRAGDRPQDGPAYGCALLSRVPLRDLQVVRMPAAPIALPLWVPGPGLVVVREEPRVAIVARAEFGTAGGVTVVGTHLPFVPFWKGRQLRRITAAVRDRPDPVLLLGDLNMLGGVPARITGYRALASCPTFPAARPRLQFDHVLLRGDPAAFGRVVATATPTLPVSDHRALVVDIDLPT